MSWHHIIPYATLRKVWNKLVTENLYSDSGESRTALRQYLSLCGVQAADEDIQRIRMLRTDRARSATARYEPLDVPAVLRLQTAVVWPSWDVVEGPARRSDDPGDHYIDRFTKGLIGWEPIRMQAIERLFGELRTFTHDPECSDAGLRRLSNSLTVARPSLVRQGPIRFRAEMWERNADGSWKKAR